MFTLRVGDGRRAYETVLGNVTLSFNFVVLEIKNCYYVKNIKQNLIYVACLLRENYFVHNKIFISKNNSVICNGMMLDNSFLLEPRFPMLHNIEIENEEPNSKGKKSSIDDETCLWHLRLGHINLNKI